MRCREAEGAAADELSLAADRAKLELAKAADERVAAEKAAGEARRQAEAVKAASAAAARARRKAAEAATAATRAAAPTLGELAGGAKAVSIATLAGKLSWAVHGRSSARSRSATTSSGASTSPLPTRVCRREECVPMR